MTRQARSAVFRRPVIAAALLILSFVSLVGAWPPGGNGGGTGGGGGTIFFRYLGDLFDGSGLSSYTAFDADPNGYYGEPSRDIHNNKRWCITIGSSGDHLVALSDADDVVVLPLEPGLEVVGAPRWGVGDALISFEGMQPDLQRGGLYAMFLEGDANGDLSGAAGPPALIYELPLVGDPLSDQLRPDLWNHDWAPGGTQFVFDAVSTEELRIADVSTRQDRLLFDASAEVGVSEPKWSPAGDRIMFYLRRWGSYPEVAIVNADGANLKTLVRGSPNGLFVPAVWSPTGSHLLVRYFDHFLKDHYIMRMTANGSAKTRLTGKNEWPAAGYGPVPTGWRD